MTEQHPVPDPSPIVDLAIGYMAAKQLFAASRVGLFRALADGPLDAAGLAAATGVGERIARILADGLSSVGLLERHHGRYELTAATRHYLGGGGLDLAPFLAFLDGISMPHWQRCFDETVDTGEPGSLELDEAGWERFMAGVMTYNRLHAQGFGTAIDFSPYRNALDLGGLAAFFSIEAMRANAELRTTFVFAPDFADSIEAAVVEAGLGERAAFAPAPTVEASPEGSFDLVFLNHVVHRFSAEENLRILRNARAAAAPGARLVLLDFFLDDDETQRRIDALHAAEYFVIDGTVVWPESVVRGWLAETGWVGLPGTVDGPGSPRLLLAEAS